MTESATYRWDVAISFAGAQRDLAEQLATLIKQAGLRVFYDRFEAGETWGEDLSVRFLSVFRDESRFCVIFVSKEYRDREWTIHELRSAITREIRERGKAYIFPIMVEKVELPGLYDSTGYLSLKNHAIEEIAEILIKKLRSNVDQGSIIELLEKPQSGKESLRVIGSVYEANRTDFNFFLETIPKWPATLTTAFAKSEPSILSDIVLNSAENLPDHFPYSYLRVLSSWWGEIYRGTRSYRLRNTTLNSLIGVGVRFDQFSMAREVAHIIASIKDETDLEDFARIAASHHGSGRFLQGQLNSLGVWDSANSAVVEHKR